MSLLSWFRSLVADEPPVIVLPVKQPAPPVAAEAVVELPAVKVSSTAKPRKRNKPRK